MLLASNAEKSAKKVEDYPSIFGNVNLTHIKENIIEILKLIGRDGIFREYTLHDANHIDEIHASFEEETAYFGLLAYIQQYATKEIQRCHEWAISAEKMVPDIGFHGLI
jgi:hypothetical protein